MEIAFDRALADGLKLFDSSIREDRVAAQAFKSDPTSSVKKFLEERGIEIPTPDLFHAHAIGPGNPLPQEPERATVDRYVYIYRENGIFEFKTIPGSPKGDDAVMSKSGACCCCNCGCFEIA